MNLFYIILIASGSGVVGNSPILAAAISGAKLKDPAISSNMYKVRSSAGFGSRGIQIMIWKWPNISIQY